MFALFPLLAGAVVSMVPAVPTMLCQRRRTARSRSQPIFCAEGRPSLDNLKTLDTLINRGLDTVEDAWLLARRVTADYVDPIDCLESWEDPEDTRPRLLVIGSGWAAHALVKIVDADLYRLLVVSPRNYFLFTPMLAASSVGNPNPHPRPHPSPNLALTLRKKQCSLTPGTLLVLERTPAA